MAGVGSPRPSSQGRASSTGCSGPIPWGLRVSKGGHPTASWVPLCWTSLGVKKYFLCPNRISFIPAHVPCHLSSPQAPRRRFCLSSLESLPGAVCTHCSDPSALSLSKCHLCHCHGPSLSLVSWGAQLHPALQGGLPGARPRGRTVPSSPGVLCQPGNH